MGLDGVELVMAWEDGIGIDISDAEAGRLRTPRMATDLICRLIDAENRPGSCLSQRAFYRLRRAFLTVLRYPRISITPRARLADLIPRRERRRTWHALSAATGVPFPKFLFGLPRNYTVAKLVQCLVAYYPQHLLSPNVIWNRKQVREVVRAAIAQQLGIPEFSDDADFVYDLRVD